MNNEASEYIDSNGDDKETARRAESRYSKVHRLIREKKDELIQVKKASAS